MLENEVSFLIMFHTTTYGSRVDSHNLNKILYNNLFPAATMHVLHAVALHQHYYIIFLCHEIHVSFTLSIVRIQCLFHKTWKVSGMCVFGIKCPHIIYIMRRLK